MIKRYAKLIAMISLLLIGCNNQTNSFQDSKRQKFSIRNKKDFRIDGQLMADLKTNLFISSSHQLFDTTIGAPVYLYSWQERDSSTNEFTVIRNKNAFEDGLRIYYYILDTNDRLLSWKHIAGRGTEGIFWFETQSKFLNKDTLTMISSITQWYDLENNRKMMPPKGDTTFTYLTFGKGAQIREEMFRKVNNLGFLKH